MSIKLSNRVQAVKPSPTLAITARAAQMRAAGKDIIGLGAGEPDFDTPDHIKAAAVKAIENGQTKYTAVDGIASLKKAIIAKYKNDNGLDYQPNQVLVSCGGKQSSFNLTQALLNAGDEVIIPAPFWVSYPDMVLLADGVPVIIETTQAQHFKITPEQLRAAITDKTRLIFINSPSNPSGVAYNLEELKALGDVLKDFPNIIIATDDMYEHILWKKGTFVNILNAHPELYDRTVVMNGVSKAYSMTGWRIGYAAGPADLIEAMTTIQSQSTSNPTSISQHAAEAALTGDQSFIDDMCVEFKKRHDYVVSELNSIDGVECLETDGTFYVFPNVEKLIARLDNIDDDLGFSEYLIEQAGVALVPGSAFGTPGHIRISIATSMANLQNALERIKKAI
ncbi:pyridoxal phosphate-dependent aminotransferase [Methylobacter sp. Wu8]|uniref:Aminotransferase n=1 Tax=Methylobacter tundripaludum TaxID=173365 RepID=A0A2S6H456_9GAMM|nr:pyridoxal phosphate-dependent aminotransferase [Methylobacter tundripaludum]PPK72272.1 aspartate aminotransferase [Methylobacter tundripaludum]